MNATQLTQLRKVLDELAAKFPRTVTPAYIARRIAEETAGKEAHPCAT